MEKQINDIDFYKEQIVEVLGAIKNESTIKLIYGFVLGGYEKDVQERCEKVGADDGKKN